MELPALFLDRMARLLGDEYLAFREALAGHPHVGLRANTLKIAPQELAARLPFRLEPVPWCPAGFRLVAGRRPGAHPYHAAGLYYIQEPAAMAPAEILAPRPGERVIDLAAAPGGKTTHLAALMGGEGLLVANDVQPHRAREMTNNLDRWGATHIVVLSEKPQRLADRWGAFFDRVLLDAPCSGEGMFRKDPAARSTWTPRHVQRCAALQEKILRHAARLVRPGGYLLYSTCTFNPEENEGAVARFLAAHPDFDVVPVPPRQGFAPGRPDWLTPPGPESLRHAVRLWPHKAPAEGHFMVLLRRGEDAQPPPSRVHPLRTGHLTSEQRQLYRRFVEESLTASPAPALRLAAFGHRLYAVPEGLPNPAGLQVVRFGWWLGTFKKGRFEPSPALAPALRPADAQRVADFPPDHPALADFLGGRPTPYDGPPGWTLVCVDGFPLGWGKVTQGVLKSKAPRWLRRVRW